MHHNAIYETDAIKQHYSAINAFFELFDLPYISKHIQTSLLAANNENIWKGRSPADLVFFYQEFEKLVTVLKSIATCGCVREAAIIQTATSEYLPNLNCFELYCHKFDQSQHWLYIPRHLSVKEFINPYKAIKKATRFLQQEYFDDLFEYIVQYALSHNTMLDEGREYDTLEINMQLQKLAEAAHLIYVRTCGKAMDTLQNVETKTEDAQQ